MFGIPSVRIAELSRPDYPREVTDYARLEFPHEEARTVLHEAVQAARDHPAPRGHFWSFRSRAVAEGVSNKA